MMLVALGLNHRSAPLDVLERMSLSADLVPKALAELTSGDHVNEGVLVSTCNRVEVYAHVERFHDGYEQLRDALAVLTGVDASDFADHLYVYSHDEAVRHLFTVTAGLDSAVLRMEPTVDRVEYEDCRQPANHVSPWELHDFLRITSIGWFVFV